MGKTLCRACQDAKSNARETLVVNRYLAVPIEFIQARRMLWPENSVRGSKISSIRIGARRAYKHNKRLPELRTINSTILYTLIRLISPINSTARIQRTIYSYCSTTSMST